MEASRPLRRWRGNPDVVASFLSLPEDNSDSSAPFHGHAGLPGTWLSSAGMVLLAPPLPLCGFSPDMPLQTSGPSGYAPRALAEDVASEDAEDSGLGPSFAWDRGPGHMQHEHNEHEEPPEPAHHDNDEMMMADIGLAMISSGMTVMLAMMGAVCALRICREMLRRRGAAGGATGNAVENQALLDGSVQAFRPFAGQGYRLVVEGDVTKPPTPRMSPETSTEDKGRADSRFPSETGLPNFGAGLTSHDA